MLRLLVVFSLLSALPLAAQTEKPLLLRNPTASKTHVVFSFAGDLWSVSRQGGEAVRLTTGVGTESGPRFSPDGALVAFTGEYDGNVDVYVVPASGGVPKRLTYHPGADVLLGWTPDGKEVLFRSGRSRWGRLYRLSVEGGMPTEIQLPMAYEGSLSPDQTHIAYVPLPQAFGSWKRYRGGRTTPIWIAKLSDASVVKVPRDNSNDFNPMWIGDKVYFLSDRKGPITLYAYDTKSRKVEQVLENPGFDLKAASAGPDVIAYEQFGTLHLLDLKTGKPQKLEVRLTGDLPEVRPRYVRVGNAIRSARISPTGARAVFQARGEIFTVPAEKGDVRNLTNTPGVAERDPAWSPDGRWIAYFSDESGEYALHLREQNPTGEVRKIRLLDQPTFYYQPTWSPDSKRIAFSDKRQNLWWVDIDTRRINQVDSCPYGTRHFSPSWSPDSRWIAYSKELRNGMSAVFLHSLSTRRSHQITDGMSDARNPEFDRSGKYLYFTASTDLGPSTEWNMGSWDYPRSRSVYVVVLNKSLPSPLAPESDEEKVKEPEKPADKPAEAAKADEKKEGAGEKKEDEKAPEAKPADAKKEPEPVRIDLEGIDQRILALPIPARNYGTLQAGKSGILFLIEYPQPGPSGSSSTVLYKFDLSKRKLDRVMDNVGALLVSANGEKVLLAREGRWAIQSADAPKPGEGILRTDAMEARVDPAEEWRQMYNEVWRIERDFFYDPGLHGLDLEQTRKRFEPWLAGLASRADLNYLFSEMLGELSVGHLYIGGGDGPDVRRVPVGLLGADYEVENGRYRFARIYSGENWNPDLQAPLTQPGVNVSVGDYLIAVNGREVRAPENLYSFFEGTAGRQTLIKVGPNPDGRGAREVTVVPIDNENGLRYRAWVEENRRKVDQMTDGRVAYVYLPDTGGGGYVHFNRYYFAQVGKEGLIIDERFNGGGVAADFVMDHLRRTPMGYWNIRDRAEDWITPNGTIFGPKAMIINEFAGSGGDYMPYMFRRAGLGPLIGKRTWGGLVGIGGYPDLIDGGSVTAPHFAFYSPEGDWLIENRGVAPDIEVEFDPQAWRAGRDPQLEKAVEVVLEELRKNPPQRPKRPAYPNYHASARDRGADRETARADAPPSFQSAP